MIDILMLVAVSLIILIAAFPIIRVVIGNQIAKHKPEWYLQWRELLGPPFSAEEQEVVNRIKGGE